MMAPIMQFVSYEVGPVITIWAGVAIGLVVVSALIFWSNRE